jgi:hypothetical protein
MPPAGDTVSGLEAFGRDLLARRGAVGYGGIMRVCQTRGRDMSVKRVTVACTSECIPSRKRGGKNQRVPVARKANKETLEYVWVRLNGRHGFPLFVL